MGLDPFSIIMFVASTAYQRQQQKKMKKKQAAAAEARKGFEFTTSGEAAAIPVVYGKNTLGGITVKHHITSGFTTGSLGAATHFVENLDHTTTVAGSKNEYLHAQYAICQDGIEGVQGVKINDLDYNDAGQLFSHSIRTYEDGGTADAIATANGIASTNTFTDVAFASATFKLNRDDPQYNGSPQMGFILKGRKVRAVEINTGVYSLATSYVYSNNPALCLLDYMLNADFGRGITVAELDLQSFYDAAIVCGTTVSSGRAIAGVVNGGVGVRDIPLYECNLTLDPNNTIRDNIESIMDTMAMAELTWTSDGKYKLLVEYPTSEVEQDALVDASHYFTEDDIIRDSLFLSWPSAADRFNQVTVAFLNEHEDFKSDSMTWPKTNSTAHTTYLTEDNSQPFVGSTTLDGVTDPYHALAMAEQMVRQSRSIVTLTLTVTKKGLSLEPGDFINVTAPNSGISDEVYRVQSIEVMADFTVNLTCYLFDHNALAWNVNDDIAYSVRPTYNFTVEPVSSVVYTAGKPTGDHTAVAELTWTAAIDGSFKSIVYYTDGSGDLVVLGETSNTSFYIYPRDDWANNQSVTFTVKAQTPFGRLSTGVTVVDNVIKDPTQPTTFGLVESLYQTNNAAGVKARATLSWTQPSGVGPKDYRVEYYRDEDGSTYSLLGYTPKAEFTFNDVRSGNYHFRITPISWFNNEGTALVGTSAVLGLSATPADPTGFGGRVQQTGIILSWDKATDLDVLFGGHTQIRFTKDTGSTPNWPDAQVLVNQVDGNATSKSVPLAAGYFLIKHFDSTGNESAQAVSFLNAHQGATFTQVDSAEEATTFTGTKTNCAVVDGTLAMDAGFAVLQYQFADTVDLGEVAEVSLTPSFVANSYDHVTLVSSYADISALTSFAGVANKGSVSFEVRHTDDDPAGTPTWSAWEPLIGGFFNKRAFQIRMNATVTDTGFTVRFSSIAVSVEKEDLTKSGTSTSSASADTTVTYASAFYGGTAGTTTPRLGVAIIGGSYGDTVVIVSRTKSSFDYSVYNSAGTRIAIDVDWQAIGQ
jgi:preprotein translocase subunit YajC